LGRITFKVNGFCGAWLCVPLVRDMALSSPSYTIRPAIASDRWHIQRLLSNFDRETPRHSRQLHYLLLFFLTALGINFFFLLGLKFILGMAAGAICVLMVSLLSVVFSREWKKFWVIEQNGHIVACGKLCEYVTYSMLYNILVLPENRHQGLGSALVKHLAGQATKPLYLACYPNRIGFYTRLGFVQMRSSDLSPMLRHELGISTRPEIVPLVLR
jgi:N-acetylglutamate synthase-like GNAT family acetyltransferase